MQLCFSPTASFSAGIVLIALGGIAIALNKHRRMFLFAAVPLFFGIQQIFEGVVWLGILHTQYEKWTIPAATGFLLFAQGWWPVYTPLCALAIENRTSRRKALFILLLLGVCVASYMSFRLIMEPFTVESTGQHIHYDMDSTRTGSMLLSVFYVAVTVLPLLLSSRRGVIYIGLIIAASLAATQFALGYYLISVWCFFAAVISGGIILIVLQERRNP